MKERRIGIRFTVGAAHFSVNQSLQIGCYARPA